MSASEFDIELVRRLMVVSDYVVLYIERETYIYMYIFISKNNLFIHMAVHMREHMFMHISNSLFGIKIYACVGL